MRRLREMIMARSDLLVTLIKASSTGDRKLFVSTVEAIVAEERAKQHNIFADRLIRAMNSNGNGSLSNQSFQDRTNKTHDCIAEVIPQKRLEDLFLTPVCLNACRQLIEEQVRADLLRAHSLEPRHRILLVGPPGNGKTSLAEALAESLGSTFFIVRYESMIGSYLGETAIRLKRIFDYARTIPCVLFFDEFDAIGKERGDLHETGEIKRVVTSLLMQIDELPSYTIIVAATNHAELLDRAVWRRFQLRLELPTPTQTDLEQYLKEFEKHLEKPIGLKIATIAKKLGTISFAEVEQFCMDIRRRDILTMGEKTLKEIVNEQLKQWITKIKVQEKAGLENAGKTPSDSS